MLQGIALQAVIVRPGADDPAATVQQAMWFPAAKMVWTRTISELHPKRQWRGWDTRTINADLFRASGVRDALSGYAWADRSSADWHLTGDPVGFQITNDEYKELKRRIMPRNVALRYSRALDARSATLIGKGATRKPAEFRNADGPLLMEQVGIHGDGATTNDILAHALKKIDNAVDSREEIVLRNITPRAARARGAGRARNAADLLTDTAEPDVAPEPAPAAAAPAPAPVVKTRSGAVKPGDRIVAADGVPYVARKVLADEKDLSDVELFRRAYADSMNVLLLGEPGTGKTRGLLAAFPDALLVTVTGDTEVSDLIGPTSPRARTPSIWVDGPLVEGDGRGQDAHHGRDWSGRLQGPGPPVPAHGQEGYGAQAARHGEPCDGGPSSPRTASASLAPRTPMPRACTSQSRCCHVARSR